MPLWNDMDQFVEVSFDRNDHMLIRIPDMDVKEHPDYYALSVELNGVGERDLNMAINGRELKIKVRRENKRYGLQHASYSYFRRFDLPIDADPRRIRAEWRGGRLFLRISKKQDAGKNSERRIAG